MAETTAQKTARLRALREARDGSPAEQKARALSEAAARKAAANVRADRALARDLSRLHDALPAKDRADFLALARRF